MEVVKKGAIGVAIIVTIKEDGQAVSVSAVTTKEITFKKPNGTVVTKAAEFTAALGLDGDIQYVTESGFLDVSGPWEVEGYVAFPGGFSGESEIGTFEVRESLA